MYSPEMKIPTMIREGVNKILLKYTRRFCNHQVCSEITQEVWEFLMKHTEDVKKYKVTCSGIDNYDKEHWWAQRSYFDVNVRIVMEDDHYLIVRCCGMAKSVDHKQEKDFNNAMKGI